MFESPLKRHQLVLNYWQLQSRHGGRLKQHLAGLRNPAGPLGGTIDPCTVAGDPGVGVHLPVEFGDEQKREARSQSLQAGGSFPDSAEAEETVPRGLSSDFDFLQ